MVTFHTLIGKHWPPSCRMYGSKNYKVFKEEKSIEILEILGLIIHVNE